MKFLPTFALVIAAIGTSANAATPVGQWDVTTYNEKNGSLYSNVGICIKSDNTWYLVAPSNSTGHGSWLMRGNNIHLHGNLHENNELNEAIELSIINPKLLTGAWQEWMDDMSLNLYFTTKWVYKKNICDNPV